MKYQKRTGDWKYHYRVESIVLCALEMAAAFVGMHTTGGVPKEYVGRFDYLLEDPETALSMLLGTIKQVRGK